MALPVLSSSGVKFRRVLAHFPQELSLGFAYGSGVFRQAGPSAGHSENNMLDFVFAVDDSVTWHMMNLLKNKSHYSFLKVFGPKQISNIQSYGAGIYYNTLVPCNGRNFWSWLPCFDDNLWKLRMCKLMIKYGVISTDALIDDLLHWRTLYVAGRLQKPIDKSPEGQFTQLMALPKNLQQKITSLVDPPGKNRDVEEILLQVAHDPDCGLVVHQGISGIVRSSSIVQSAKTILTAGAKKICNLQCEEIV
ncbi:phosphatidate cytidylyltransferase, mitochondrial isoform X2 [Cygnus atratus]|uniref:phosphatidate cytidylyltransferase, mitochondrial isoform X2 n=1 Tax=Cygnus atratus TaxID=8868 RepID=UPI0021B7A041|nr:phosphatidate cytidylyltransferase, mitochondrial isoform X2 [Cygnus atratus]